MPYCLLCFMQKHGFELDELDELDELEYDAFNLFQNSFRHFWLTI